MSDTWTIGELAEHAAHLLPSSPRRPNGRVRDVPNERLIRWYTTIGLLDPPLTRRGRVALYGRRHLLQLVAVKRLQAEGRSIADIQAELAGATDTALEQIVDAAGRPVPVAPRPSATGDPAVEPTGDPAEDSTGDPAGDPPSGSPRARPRFWAARPAAAGTRTPATDPAAAPAHGRVAAVLATESGRSTPAAEGGTGTPATAGGTGSPVPSGGSPQAANGGPPVAPGGPAPGLPGGQATPPDFLAAPFAPEQALPRPAGRWPGVVPAAAPADDLVHGVRLAPGVTLLLEGRPPAPGDIAALREAAAPLLALLHDRGLLPSGVPGHAAPAAGLDQSPPERSSS
ncbi:MerR family transcriptional regulator [Sphaerisporangium sp. NPDC005288]|uniref:MerR family transcriptional regulator n=1 Tax=Sphaerisporangium sp. NPDC005288 TaxID=3155114 RepID=UPI0033A139D4